MDEVVRAVDDLANSSRFSGVIRIDRPDHGTWAKAYGYRNRAFGVEVEIQSLLAIASGAKAFTALAVMTLVEEGMLELGAPVRPLLGTDLPLIADDVTVEHLLAHRSGIGDYLDEDQEHDVRDYVLPVPVHTLETTEQYLAVLDGHHPKFPPGQRFSYCNSGYVVLALVAERAARVAFHELVRRRVCERAGLTDTSFLRSDELPGRAGVGYLDVDGLRTNTLHVPVVGSGDGGIYTTIADIHALWHSFMTARIVSAPYVEEMLRPRSRVADKQTQYALGFWLRMGSDAVLLEGYDAGISFRSVHDPSRDVTWTVIGTSSPAAWPIVHLLDELGVA